MNEITHLISFILEKAEVNSKTNLYERLYRLNIKNHENDKAGFRDRVITFNYDTLFDQHFNAHFQFQELYFDKLANVKPTKKFRRNKRYDHPVLLKLHGSTNWICEQTEFENMLKVTGDSASCFVEKVWLRQAIKVC